MIETNDYCIDITVGTKGTDQYVENLLTSENDLGYFEMCEECGAVVPYFDIAIKLHAKKEDKKDYSMLFKQGTIVNLSIGPDKLHLKNYKLSIGEAHISQANSKDAVRTVRFDAVIDKKCIQYLTNRNPQGQVVNKTSIEAIKQLGKEYFNTDLVTDINKVNETPMTWRQNGMVNNMFLTHIWLHTNIRPDVPLMYIDDKLTIHLNSYSNIKNGKVQYVFTPKQVKDGGKEIQFLNSFNPQANKLLFNTLGSEQQAYVTSADTGKVTVLQPDIQKAELASTTKVETTKGGGGTKVNKVESANVYKGYKTTYLLNRNKLNYLSGVSGYIVLAGLRDDIKLLSLVQIKDVADSDNGKYIVFDKRYRVGHGMPFQTVLFLCRDNTNNCEKYILDADVRKNAYDSFKSDIQTFYGFVKNLRKYVVMARYSIDGSLYRDIVKFGSNLKTNLLKSFTVLGVPLDFNTADELFNSMKSIGNGLINTIVKTYLPAPFNSVLQNFALQDPSMKKLVGDLLARYAPSELRYLITEINGLLTDITAGLNRVAKDANAKQIAITASTNYVDNKDTSFVDTPSGVIEVKVEEKDEMDSTQKDTQKRVDDIIEDFINNTKDLDLPMPIIDLTDEEKLLDDADLKDLLADIVMKDLTEKGYLEGINTAIQNDNNNTDVDFKDVLYGKAQIGFNTIDTVQGNVGLVLYSRYWGIFKDPTELTDFYIKDQFRDMYKTVEFQRLVSARKGERIFVALPVREDELKFFINSTLQTMEIIPNVNLGIQTVSGSPVLYNIYLSPEGYNSNSNLLEVRK